MTKRIAIVGGGIAGVTAAWQLAHLARAGADLQATLFEASDRFGGTVETVHRDGFTIECGPDGWVTEKPWAAALVRELGLEGDLQPSNDATRKTHIYLDGGLETMPDGMRMMVPTDLDALEGSTLFSEAAKQAYRAEVLRADELLASAPFEDESIASFTRRHFGEEVLERIAAPLLSGVLGGDVERLSVQAVLPQFVAMEREYGSLISALQARVSSNPASIFTTLRSGLGTLVDRLVESTPRSWMLRNAPVEAIQQCAGGWTVRSRDREGCEEFDTLLLTVSPTAAKRLLLPVDPAFADLLSMEASSAIVVALGFAKAAEMDLPPGFGFLVPPNSGRPLLACTFVDQKFADRVPPGARLLRAFFGGEAASDLLRKSDEEVSGLAVEELTSMLGALPPPTLALVRRWPCSLPQYAIGHLQRMRTLEKLAAEHHGLTLLGNGYRGVGLPDLIRDARAAARCLAEG